MVRGSARAALFRHTGLATRPLCYQRLRLTFMLTFRKPAYLIKVGGDLGRRRKTSARVQALEDEVASNREHLVVSESGGRTFLNGIRVVNLYAECEVLLAVHARCVGSRSRSACVVPTAWPAPASSSARAPPTRNDRIAACPECGLNTSRRKRNPSSFVGGRSFPAAVIVAGVSSRAVHARPLVTQTSSSVTPPLRRRRLLAALSARVTAAVAAAAAAAPGRPPGGQPPPRAE